MDESWGDRRGSLPAGGSEINVLNSGIQIMSEDRPPQGDKLQLGEGAEPVLPLYTLPPCSEISRGYHAGGMSKAKLPLGKVFP